MTCPNIKYQYNYCSKSVPTPPLVTGLTSIMTTSVIPASNSRDQSVLLGVVGGVLAVGAILAVSVASAIIVVFTMKKRKRMPVEKGTLCHVAA